MDEKELEKLYAAVSGKFDIGDYNSFKSRMSTTEDRKKFFDVVGSKGFDLGDYNQYETRVAGVKKKVDGAGSTNYAFPSTSELFGGKGSVSPRLDGEQVEENPIDAVLNSQSKLKATKKETRTRVEKAFTIGDTDKTITEEIDVPDTDTQLRGAAEETALKEKGIDVEKYKKLFGDVPQEYFNIPGFTKDEISHKFKVNPLEGERFVQGNKASFALQDAIDVQQQRDPNTDYAPIKNLILDAGNNTNYSQRRQDNAAIVKSMDLIQDDEQRQKIQDDFAASQAYVYGQHSEDIQEQQNNPLSDRLNSNQLTALDYIKDVHPELLDGFGAAMVNPKDIKGNVDAELGQQEKAKKLEEIGINLKTSYAQEELTRIAPRYEELVKVSQERELTIPEQQEASKLEADRQKLVGMMNNAENEIANMNANYPLAARLDADNFAQELLGEKNTGLSHVALTMGKATNNTYEGIVNAVKTPFLSKADQDINQAEIIGSGSIDDNITYLGQDKQLMQTFKGKVSKEMQADIDLIKNNKLYSLNEKRNKVQDLLLSRPKEWQRVPIEGGKSNIGLVSMLYGTGDLAANLVPFIALEGITGGGATAGALRKFTSVFASAAATSYQETLRGAIQEGVDNPYEKAWRVTTINSLAMAGAGTPAAIRKLASVQKGLVKDGIMKMTDDQILMALRETPKQFSLLKKAYNIGAKVGTSAVAASKEAVRFGMYTTAGQVVNDAIDGKLQNVEHYGKHAAIEALKFAAFGTAMGTVAKLQQGHNETNKATIFEAARNPETYLKAVEERLSNGTLNIKEGQQIKNNITKASEVLKKVPMVDAKGNPLSEQGSRDLLILKMQEKDIEETLSKDIPKELFTKMEERLVDVQDKMDKVYKGTFVDENTLSKREALLNTSRDLISKNQVKGFSAIPLKDAAVLDKKELETYLENVAEQANDPLSNKSAIETYGESLVNISQRLFPKVEEKITEPIEVKNELPIQEEKVSVDAPLVGKEEITLPKKEGTGSEVEPIIEGGRTVVTKSGLTETQRQEKITVRGKETEFSERQSDEQSLLEKIHTYNNLPNGRLGKLKPEGIQLLNEIRNTENSLNEKHSANYKFDDKSGDLRNGKRKLSRSYLDIGDKAIVNDAVPLRERSVEVKETFDTLLENGAFIDTQRLDGKRMSEAELEATIQDVLDGIPSRRANEYLNNLEQAIKDDAFQIGDPKMVGKALSLNEITGAKKENVGEQMTEEAIDKWLNDEVQFTPEIEQIIFDNVENLINDYEQSGTKTENGEPLPSTEKTSSGETKPISTDTEAKQTEKVNDAGQQKENEIPNTKEKGGASNEPPNKAGEKAEDSEGKKPEGVLLSHKGLQEIATQFDLPDITERERVSDLEEFAAADKTLDKWDAEGTYKKNIEKIINDAETGEALNFQQRVLLQQHIANEKAKVVAVREKNGINSREYDVALNGLNKLIRAGETARSTAGAALRTGEIRSTEKPTMEDWMNEKKESLEVDDLTNEQKEDIEKQFKEYEEKISKSDAKVKEYEEELAKLKAELALKETALEQRKTVRKKTRESLTKEREDILKSIQEKLKKSRNENKAVVIPYLNDLIAVSPDVAKLVKNLLETGTSKLEDVVDIIYTNLQSSIPSITKKDVNDLIGGKYNPAKPTRSQLALELSDLKTEAKLITELERLEAGGIPSQPKQAAIVNQKLKKLRDAIKEYGKDNMTLNAIKKRNETQLKQIEKDIKDGNFETKKKVPFDENEALKATNPKLWKETMDAISERRDAKQRWELSKLEDERSKMNKIEKLAYYAEGAVATSRAIVSGIDDSFVFVQAGIAMAANPRSGLKAFNQHWQDAISPKRFNRQLSALHSSPKWNVIQKSGLDVLEPASLTAKKVEEMFDKNLLNKTFTMKGKEYNLWKYTGGIFERAFISMGNNLRVNIFLKRIEQLEGQGKTFESHPQDFKDAARVINEMTGRGKLNKHIEQASPLITPIIWSPRMIASSLNILGVSDIAYGVMGKKGYYASLTPSQRKFAIAQTTKGIGMGISIMALSAYAGADDVDYDPNSVTFGNIRFGTKSYNVFGRFSGYVKLIAQQVMGSRNLPNGAEQKLSGKQQLGILGKFARGKMTPFAGYIYDFKQGENSFTRKPVTLKDAPQALLMPMSSQEIGKGLQQDGSISLLTRFLPSFTGLKVTDSRDFGDESIVKTPETEWIGSLGANIQPISKSQLKIEDSKGEPIEATDAQYKNYLKEFNTKLVQALAKAKKDGYYFLNDNGTTTLRQPSKELKAGEKETEAQQMASQIKEDVNKEVKNKLFPNKKNYKKEMNKSILNDYRSTWGDKLFPSTQKVEEIKD